MLHVPPAHSADMAVRSGANAPPIITPPIAKVVAGGGRGNPGPPSSPLPPQTPPPPIAKVGAGAVRGILCPVADLVPLKPGGGKPLVSQFVHVCLHVIGGRRQLTAPDAPRKRRPLLEDGGVGGDVFWPAR